MIHIVELLLVITILFLYFRRPMYECMLIAFFFVVASTNSYDVMWTALFEPARSPIFFTIVAFLVAAHLFARTGAIEAIVAIILPLVRKLPGGGGYVALVISTFMASLSGTGPGNVAASGVFTIPLMIKTGYHRALAATTEMACSSLGNIIPPSGIVPKEE